MRFVGGEAMKGEELVEEVGEVMEVGDGHLELSTIGEVAVEESEELEETGGCEEEIGEDMLEFDDGRDE